MKKLSYILLIPVLFFISCGDDEVKPIPFSQVEVFDMDHGVFGTNSIIEGADAHSGKKFSRADINNTYGIGYTYALPDSLQNDTISVNINAWVRKGDLTNSGEIVVSVGNKDSVFLWLPCSAKDVISNVNQWSQLERVINLPLNVTSREGLFITVMSTNLDGKSFFDVDDLRFEVKN